MHPAPVLIFQFAEPYSPAIQAVFLNFEVDELKKILEYSTDMILDLNEWVWLDSLCVNCFVI